MTPPPTPVPPICVQCSQEKKILELHEAIVGTPEKEGLASLMRRTSSDTQRLRETVYGNGHIGLTESVRLHNWILGVVGSGVGALLIKAAYDLLKFHFAK